MHCCLLNLLLVLMTRDIAFRLIIVPLKCVFCFNGENSYSFKWCNCLQNLLKLKAVLCLWSEYFGAVYIWSDNLLLEVEMTRIGGG